MSARVYVGLGSNQDRDNNIRLAVLALHRRFDEIKLSPVYDSAPVGFEGDNFLNLVAGFDTDHSLPAVIAAFREIENRLGRKRQLSKFVSRSIDLDILLFGNMVTEGHGIRIPRAEILENAFVLRPLQDIAPDAVHPETGETFAVLWQRMAPRAPVLRRYPLALSLSAQEAGEGVD